MSHFPFAVFFAFSRDKALLSVWWLNAPEGKIPA
jgi:hypothetical protein